MLRRHWNECCLPHYVLFWITHHRIRSSRYVGHGGPVVLLSGTSELFHPARTRSHEGTAVTMMANIMRERERGATTIETVLSFLIILALTFGLMEACLALYRYHYIA